MNPASTRNLDVLPDPEKLKALLQSLAVLDVLVSPYEDFRYYSFNAQWQDGMQTGHMSNGQGDELNALFCDDGCVITGLVHDCAMRPVLDDQDYNEDDDYETWEGVIDDLPEELYGALTQNGLPLHRVSFCIWRLQADSGWSTGSMEFAEGNDPDGSGYLLDLLDGNPESYQQYCQQIHEFEISIDTIRHIYDHKPVTGELLNTMKSEAKLADIEGELKSIGY